MWKSSTLNTKALVKHCNFVYQSSFISLQYMYVLKANYGFALKNLLTQWYIYILKLHTMKKAWV